jgi:hypothetical protein
VYLALAIGSFFTIRGFIRALREQKAAVFGLEREISNTHARSFGGGLLVLILLGLGEFFLYAFVGPGMPSIDNLSTPTLEIVLTPGVEYGNGTIEPSVATSTATINGCVTGQIAIDYPRGGDTITGDVIIMGTAEIPDFGFYKYEFTPAGMDNWATILAGRESVVNDELGHWDTSQLASGDYLFQLVVTDNQGSILPPCIVSVRVSNP